VFLAFTRQGSQVQTLHHPPEYTLNQALSGDRSVPFFALPPAPAWPVPLQWMAGAASAAGDVALAASAARKGQGLTQHLAAVRARVVAKAA
jgi:hypothetical protein